MSGMTYQSSGVDYGPLDAFKVACQQAAAKTADQLALHGLAEAAGVRGESAYLVETADGYLAHVEEGLGTKNLVADAMQKLTGKSFYRNVGIDVVATIVNDLITVGALPISVAMHAAVGDSSWFEDRQRAADLADGFAHACRLAGAVWGGGETPALKGIIQPGTICLAGSAMGQITNKSQRITGQVKDGDAIVLLASTGVQTNGLTLCRALADRLPEGYLTKMGDGRAYGQALLDASAIYVDFVAACQKANINLHYAAHMTGHGWRKLMRLPEPFVYEMTDVGTVPAIFDFLMKQGPIDLKEAYGTFNMGAGFAVYVQSSAVNQCLEIAGKLGHTAWLGGQVRKQGDRKAVEIGPLKLTYDAQSLKLR